ncbi:hypothetical protein [Paeniglutamicibacter psychrophenolicus]|uniref:hypothetical protein n=1 Tax=Paeniglutamicibacter psychrophenolicus TaxID=257454 RepID=UPI002785946D|nr:hypothetical protein [Paeniglutamicibacter psychrophenolicus]MDQ0095990.1 NAD(P)-dependent dehydrogenase (short-subunit alcohol dehydrogenase family) [Paeniglutamicibacter psychrophenolicus]
MQSLADDRTRKLALAVGASRSLGPLVARELGNRGYRVVVCARGRGACGDMRRWPQAN